MPVKHSNIPIHKEVIQEDFDDDIKGIVMEEDKEKQVDQEKLNELKKKLSKKKSETMPPKIVEEKRRSLRFGIIGLGQGGSRLSEQFYELGYPSICMNTTTQDLEYIRIPEDNKLLLEHSIGGSAKDLSIGHAAAQANVDAINAKVNEKLDDSQVFLVCTSLGGGSGAGSVPVVIDVLSALGKPIVVICILPMSTDDALTKNNALETLSKLSKLVKNKQICNLIVADNAKVEAIYNNVSQLDFFKVSNQAIVETIDVFNVMSTKASFDKPLDSLEWAKILTDGDGLSIYGKTMVPNFAENEVAIADAVINNLENGLLASGFDLKTAKYAGVLIIANEKVWKQIPNSSVSYAMSIISEMSGGSVEGTFKGVYVDNDMKEDAVKILSFFSGLGLPDSRVKQLQKDTKAELERTKQRSENRNVNLTLESTTTETMSEAEKVKELIKKNNSTFSKTFGNGKKDFRK